VRAPSEMAVRVCKLAQGANTLSVLTCILTVMLAVMQGGRERGGEQQGSTAFAVQ